MTQKSPNSSLEQLLEMPQFVGERYGAWIRLTSGCALFNALEKEIQGQKNPQWVLPCFPGLHNCRHPE